MHCYCTAYYIIMQCTARVVPFLQLDEQVVLLLQLLQLLLLDRSEYDGRELGVQYIR